MLHIRFDIIGSDGCCAVYHRILPYTLNFLCFSDEPCICHRFGKFPLKAPLKVWFRCMLLFLQTAVEGQRIHSTDGHALSIDGIEGAECITRNNKTRRPSLQAFKATQAILRCTIAANERQRLCYTERLIDAGIWQVVFSSLPSEKPTTPPQSKS